MTRPLERVLRWQTGLCSTACLIGLSDRWPYSLKQKPKTQRQFEDSHGRIVPPPVNYAAEARKNEENEGAGRTPCTGDHTNRGQCSGDVLRLEPQVAANGGPQCPKQQADVVLVEAAEVEPRQDRQLVWSKRARVISAAQKPQSGKEIERRQKPREAMDQAATCCEQSEVLVYRLEDHVKRCKQHDHANAVKHVACDADAE